MAALAVTFTSIVARVQTMADFGIRVTLDLPDSADSIAAMAVLAECRRQGIVLSVRCEAAGDGEASRRSGDV